MTALKKSLKVAEDLFLHLSWLSEDSVACSDVKRLSGGFGCFCRCLEDCSRCLRAPGKAGPHCPASQAIGGQLM